MRSSTYYFHLGAKILADFQICISVPWSQGMIRDEKFLRKSLDPSGLDLKSPEYGAESAFKIFWNSFVSGFFWIPLTRITYTARYRIVDFSGLVKSLTFSKVQILYIFRACMILYLDRKGWNSFNKQYWCDLEVLCSYCWCLSH